MSPRKPTREATAREKVIAAVERYAVTRKHGWAYNSALAQGEVKRALAAYRRAILAGAGK